MKATRRFFLAAILLTLISPPLAAQATTGTILGAVTAEDGTPLPGVRIIATSPKLIGDATAVTGLDGSFRLTALPPGVYELKFALDGFAEKLVGNLALAIGQAATLKVTLEFRPSDLPWIPDVFLDVKSPATALALDRKSFRSLPRGHRFDSLASLAPGFSDESLLLGGASVDGATAMENKYFIDGIDVTDIRDGSPGQAVAFDFVDSVQYESSGAQASFPGALGGVVSVVTRSGGERLHGEVVGYYSGALLRAHPADVLALDPDDRSQATYLPYEYFSGDNDDSRLEAGISLGGPIFKKKLWFFASFLPVIHANTRTLDYYRRFSSEWQRTERELNFLLKLTSRALPNLRLGASLVSLFHKYKGDLPGFPSDPDPYISYNDYGHSYPNLSAGFSADWSSGNNFQAGARAGFFRSNQNDPLVGSGATPYYYFRTEAPSGYFYTSPYVFPDIPPEYLLDPNQNSWGPTRPILFSMKRNIAEKLSLASDVSLSLHLAGEHHMRAGFSWTRRGQDVDNTLDAPIVSLAWDRSLGCYPYAGPGRGKYGYYAVRNSELTGPYGDFYKAYANMLALYVQDSWTLANRLTLTAGLRAESETIPSYATGNPKYEGWRPIRFNLGDKLAPRLGLVWDVRGDSSLKAFASLGVFHDELKLAMAAKAYGGFKWQSAYYTLDTYEWDKIGVNGYYPGELLLPGKTLNFREPDMEATDPGLKPMTQNEFALGLEKVLGRDIVLSARFVRRHLVQAIEDIGVSTAIGQYSYIANPGGAFIREKFAWARANGLLPQAVPDPQPARRDYDGLTVALEKRFSGNWLCGAAYTFSRLRGNYGGLAGGDGLENGLPYRSGSFDTWLSSRTLSLADASGPLPGDRPHYFKAYGTYAFPFGLDAGLVLQAMSGIPASTVWIVEDTRGEALAFLPYGRGDQKRSPFLFLANLYLEYSLRLGRNTLSLNLNVENLFNAGTAQRLYPFYNRYSVALSQEELLAGTWNIDAHNPELDPRFLMAADFLPPLEARVGIRLSF